MLVFGTCNTLVGKSQDDIIVDEATGKKFNHPFFQAANMFVGEFCCLLAYGLKLLFTKRSSTDEDEEGTEESIPTSPGGKLAKQTKLKTKINPLYLAVPATFDMIGSSLMFVALTQCAASVYQMMRGSIVVITAAMAVLFLGRKQYAHHVISLIMIVLAVAIVGLAGVVNSSKSGDE
jgi:drug/metabolite transporter (DMT)-like permease